MITRIPCPGNMMLVIAPKDLAGLYQRLLAGETWKSLARVAGCTDTGLKRCLMRSGYDVNIRSLRKAKTAGPSVNGMAVKMLSRPMIAPKDSRLPIGQSN